MRLALKYSTFFSILYLLSARAYPVPFIGSNGSHCSKALDRELSHVKNDLFDNRSRIATYAVRERLPVFEVMLHGIWVPVVLVNSSNYRAWDWVLASSLGIGQTLNALGDADHGYARLPGTAIPDEHLRTPASYFSFKPVDGARVDLLGPTLGPILHARDSGIRFRSIGEHIRDRNPESKSGVELVYGVSLQQRLNFWAYHLIKELGLVYVRFAYDPQIVPSALARRNLGQIAGLEHCNNYRCGENVDKHLLQIESHLSKYFTLTADELLKEKSVRVFYENSQRTVLSRNWKSRVEWDPDFLLKNPLVSILDENHFKPGLSIEQKGDAASYLLAYLISLRQLELKNTLGIIESRANQYGNKNISAIFIYDENISPRLFTSGNVSLDHSLSKESNGFNSNYFQVRHILPSWYHDY